MRTTASTLLYYESIGLISDIKRDAAGKRIYSEKDMKWIEMISRLRETGMNINKMKQYAKLRRIGDTTVSERKAIMQEHLKFIEDKITMLSKMHDFVTKKLNFMQKWRIPRENKFNKGMKKLQEIDGRAGISVYAGFPAAINGINTLKKVISSSEQQNTLLPHT